VTRSTARVVARLALGLALAVAAAPRARAASDTEFAAAMGEALENVKTPAGAKYDETFGRRFAEKHQKTMVRCTKGRPAKDMGSFDVLARVASDGKLEGLLAQPLTKVAACLLLAMVSDAYPAPPGPHYWVHLHMSISDKSKTTQE
jgi:hypothetical protein